MKNIINIHLSNEKQLSFSYATEIEATTAYDGLKKEMSSKSNYIEVVSGGFDLVINVNHIVGLTLGDSSPDLI